MQATEVRAAWAWRQRVKPSTARLLTLPLPHSTFSIEEFSEAGAASLRLPTPAGQERVGEVILVVGRKEIDNFDFGDS